ncbi:formate dehydrogenase subunit gamma [Noviherbaspirillum pedocola]|uniref:Formate dehydrogenase subunit gamma n=1 Tax=Noviherbaspirillum pedocola TaxID=2801341 RepID=A0A934W651_9BURK|nr:formate dehydrogenase subunit gamma [Noviherbaspirillum pedocola]MBK4733948.1 formate dehydrogenase subunit gamma [Noviherbaspirillum pedocola]
MSTAIAEAASNAAVRQIIEARRAMSGALLPILHDIQHALGHIPADAVPMVAEALNLSRAEVHGVISYYHHFREQPAGRHVVQICRAEACQARGADALVAHAKSALDCDFHHTSADGAVTLEPVYCLGHCAVGPNIAIDDALFARVSPQRFDMLVAGKRGEQ